MPRTTIIEMAPEEQAHILAAVRRARHGYVLALQILLLCAAQRTPTEIAAVLFCSRSTVYRVVKAYRAGQVGGTWRRQRRAGRAGPLRRLTGLAPALTALGAGHSAQRAAPVGVVSHAVELRHDCAGTPGPARGRGVGRDGAAVAA